MTDSPDTTISNAEATSFVPEDWAGPEGAIGEAVRHFSKMTLDVYSRDVRRIEADANIERGAIEGGYARRQLFELVQNGADELIGERGRIALLLTDEALYCANEGRPLTERGVGALLGSHNSPKSGVEIGRFGLGFKSVLGVSRSPEIFSRTGSFRFDQEENLDAVRRIKPDAERAATLRMARPLDPAREAADDPCLREMMSWATTVVRVPRDIGDTEWLSEKFAAPSRKDVSSAKEQGFPAEFLLFCSHVATLTIEDRTKETVRRIELSRDESEWILVDSGTARSTERWRVFQHTHSPSASVKADGGMTGDRDELPIHWAVPAAANPGKLWAYFPSSERMTLTGILNAPWKMNEDRTRLVEGPFNRELLTAASRLAVQNLSGVKPGGDPGQILEYLPGRRKEARGWADDIIIDKVWEFARQEPSVPDQLGALRTPGSLRYHPDAVSPEAVELWSEQRGRPIDWPHPSTFRNPTRRNRVERLAEGTAARAATVTEWLEALLDAIEDPIEASAAAIRVAGLVPLDEASKSKIVLTTTGAVVAPRADRVFMPNEDGTTVDVDLVHPDLIAKPGVREALSSMRIRTVAPETMLDAALQAALVDPGPGQWETIWQRARRVSSNAKQRLFDAAGADAADVYVRTAAGTWERLSELLVPGELVALPDVAPSHQNLLVDMAYHDADRALLDQLGARSRPAPDGGSRDEPWLRQFERSVIEEAVQRARESGAKASAEDFTLVDSGPWAGPASILDGMQEEAAATYASALLNACDLAPWTLRGRGGERNNRQVEHPLLKRVRELGVLRTAHGVRPLHECVSPSVATAVANLLPVPELPLEKCNALGVAKTVDELTPRHFEIALEEAARFDRDDRLGQAYLALAHVFPKPPKELSAVKNRTPVTAATSKVCAAASTEDVKALRNTGAPYVRVSEEAEAQALVATWGMLSVSDAIASKLVAVPVSEPELVVDAYPHLQDLLSDAVSSVSFVACSDLRRELYTDAGAAIDELDFQLDGDIAYHVVSMDDRTRIERLATALREPLDRADLDAVIDHKERAETVALRDRIKELETDAERLVALVPAAVLRTKLPKPLIDVFDETDEELSDLDVAELYLTVKGSRALESLKSDLHENGHMPPNAWAGSRNALQFVRNLGFDSSYAGTPGQSRAPAVDALGPVHLPPLHDFQARASIAIREMVQAGPDARRGFLSLPTGAGKTRVAVQSLVEAMVAGELDPPVLWIAQQDELCEQAVQSWAEVWGAVGRPGSPLRISRLWDGVRAEPVDDGGDQVVVATVQTLVGLVDDPRYEWLKYAGCVVIDEAHGSITKSYDRVLKWLELNGPVGHAPLLGLSATPFRGYNEDESAQLAERYGRHRLDEAAFGRDDVSIQYLQDHGFLARVRHATVAGSENVPLTPQQRESFERFRDIPKGVLSKIGEDTERTLRLVDQVLGLDPDWPVIFFAASIEHAETTAALLSRAGRSAAPISGETPMSVRRELIARYKAKDIKVLTNCNVLTQGFDAPQTKAVVIARPVYSPNVYQQMVGRALRGPRNGGNQECLVVNVDDNIEVHGTRLAFRDFEYLWK